MKNSIWLLMSLALSQIVVSTASATPTAYDSFSEYADGSTMTTPLNGGVGWSGAWAGNGAVGTTDGGVLDVSGSGSPAFWRYFSTPVPITAGLTYYFRCDIGGDWSSSGWWGDTITDGQGNQIAELVENNTWVTSQVGGTTFSGNTEGYTPGTVQHIIGELQWSDSTDVTLSVWVIPGTSSIPANQADAGSPTWVQTGTTSESNIGGVLLQGFSLPTSGTGATAQNLYFGPNWSDVVGSVGGPPNAPANLIATPGNATVALSWYASPGATSYNVERATVSGGPYSTISSPTTTNYTDHGVVNGTTYYYVVNAVNGNGTSGNSAQVSATPLSTAPATPTNLVAVAGNAQVVLTWSASAGAWNYSLKRSTTSGGPYTTIASPTAASYTDSAVVNGTTYYYVVSAVNGIGQSANSSQVSVIPTANVPPTALDSFAEYANGSTISSGLNGGTGWSGPWQWNDTGSQVVTNGGLEMTSGGNSHFAYWRYFSAPVTITPNLTYYFRADLEAIDPNDNQFITVCLTDGSGNVAVQVGIEHTYLVSYFGLGDRYPGFTPDYVQGTSVHLIGVCQWSQSTNLTMSVYDFPIAPGDNLPGDLAFAGEPDWVQTNPAPSVANIGGVELSAYSFSTQGSASVSNLYFGLTWAAVTPDAYVPTQPILWLDGDPATSVSSFSDASLSVNGGVPDPAGGTNLVGAAFYDTGHPQYTSMGMSGGSSETNDAESLIYRPFTSPSLLAGYSSAYYGGRITFSADVYIPSDGAFTSGDSIYLLVRYWDPTGFSGPTYYQYDVTSAANMHLLDQWQTITLTTTVPKTNLLAYVEPTLVFDDVSDSAPENTLIAYVRNVNFKMGLGPPLLAAQQVGHNIVLNWTAGGFKLQTANTLKAPTWNDFALPAGTNPPVSVPITPGSTPAFFRLKNQ